MKLSTTIVKKALLLLGLLTASTSLESRAQLSPMGVQYFQTEYLANPAMTGISQGYNLNVGYSQQWNSMPGAPVKQYLAGEFHMNEKVGLGFNIYNDEAGLLGKTRATGTFAYHLPLSADNHKLHFGISLGYALESLATEDIIGDQNDPSVSRFLERENFFDGDFGMAYSTNRLTIQAAIPNMKIFLDRDAANTVDRSAFFSSIAYKWAFGEDISRIILEPKVAFRAVKGYKNIVDAGANVNFANNQLNLSAIYHSSRSSTFGCGFNYKNMAIFGLYTTENTPMRGDSNGIFEIGLKVDVKKKRLAE